MVSTKYGSEDTIANKHFPNLLEIVSKYKNKFPAFLCPKSVA